MAQKRSFENLEDVTDEANNVEVHFGVELLSPVKKSKTGHDYFNGQVNDGTKSLRLVGFDNTTRSKLAQFVKNKTPVKATNCAIRKSRTTDDLEIHINKGTSFAASPRRLNFEFTDTSQTIEASITEISSIADGVRVNVKATIVAVAPGRTVSTGVVQEVTLEDETGTITLSLWNNNVDKLHERDAYNFSRLMVNTYRNMKVLNFSSDCSVLKLEEDTINIPATTKRLVHGTETIHANLIAIQEFQVHVWCLHCDSKLQFSDNVEIVKCQRCHLLQLINSCKQQITSRLMFKTLKTDPEFYLLDASTDVFLKLLQLVTDRHDTLQDADKIILQSSTKYDFTVTHDGIVVAEIIKMTETQE